MFVMNLVVHWCSKNNLIESWAPAEIFVMGGGQAQRRPPIRTVKALHMGKKVAKTPSNGEKGPNKEKKGKRPPI